MISFLEVGRSAWLLLSNQLRFEIFKTINGIDDYLTALRLWDGVDNYDCVGRGSREIKLGGKEQRVVRTGCKRHEVRSAPKQCLG